MIHRPGGSRRAGFTLLETMIALALVGLVLTKLTLVIDEARHAHEEESVSMQLEDQALELIDRISYAIVGSSADRLNPIKAAPFDSATINFQVSLGVDDGKAVWGDPEVIGLKEETGQLYWGQNVGEAKERIVVWANTVSQMLQDEVMNGLDDNKNDVADELGLSFVMDKKSVTIRLSLDRKQGNGGTIQVTKETMVTCRN